MLKALADRLAEAFAEYLHERVRKDLWGYAADEQLSSTDLIKEKYLGIRPAPGYPACPEHTVKADAFRTMQCDEIGMQLTESYAMFPGASVSGFYFAHPQSKYFVVGKMLTRSRIWPGVARSQARTWSAGSRPTCKFIPPGCMPGGFVIVLAVVLVFGSPAIIHARRSVASL
jgi:hypothetical protein